MQRICGLALGYRDLDDHDSLRHDPLPALVCHKKDVLGTNCSEQNRDKALAGKPTLDRLQLSAGGMSGVDKKTGADTEAIADLLIGSGVRAIPRGSRRIVLDFDAADDPIHGRGEGRIHHGHYRNYCYPPLHCLCGNIPLWAQLRGDGGFAREAIMARCGRHRLKYRPGLSRNERLQKELEPVFKEL